MIWGIFVATYSSIFICSPMLIYLGLRNEDVDRKLATGRLAELFSFSELHWNLKVIIVSTFVFNIGLTVSHCQVMPLFFIAGAAIEMQTRSMYWMTASVTPKTMTQ